MVDRLFSATPSTLDANDGQPVNTATTFGVTTAGFITHARFYAPASGGGTFTAALYELASNAAANGAALATKVFASVTADAYNEQAFDSPVAVTTGKAYRIRIHSSSGHYVATSGVFTGGPVTSGNLVAYQRDDDPVGIGALYNGAFEYGAAAFPNENGNGTNFFADVVFSLGGAEVTGTALTSLGALSSSAAGVRTVFGSAATTLGALTSSARGRGPAAAGGRNWEDLISILDNNRAMKAEDGARLAAPVYCPNDQVTLVSGWDGTLYCPFDGWRAGR